MVVGVEAASSIYDQEKRNKVSEIQVIDLNGVYNKKTKKANKGLEYCNPLESKQKFEIYVKQRDYVYLRQFKYNFLSLLKWTRVVLSLFV